MSPWGVGWASGFGAPSAAEALAPAAGSPRTEAGGAGASGTDGPSFLRELARALAQLEGTVAAADTMAQRLVTGQVHDLSAVMVASEKARLAVELAVQLRNKALEAYQEIMRMPI
ncbi:MAG TPA: flagellar hook-basal body complex protein FliE [Thermaerobacter sp.]